MFKSPGETVNCVETQAKTQTYSPPRHNLQPALSELSLIRRSRFCYGNHPQSGCSCVPGICRTERVLWRITEPWEGLDMCRGYNKTDRAKHSAGLESTERASVSTEQRHTRRSQAHSHPSVTEGDCIGQQPNTNQKLLHAHGQTGTDRHKQTHAMNDYVMRWNHSPR